MTTPLQIEGIDVHVEGDGDQTIVMIHGWPDTYRLWDAQVATLKSDYRCVRFTLPGFDIAKPRRAFSIAETVDIFRKIIEQVSPDKKVILMLHDWGCIFGYEFYARHASMVSKIIAVDIGDASSKATLKSLSGKAIAMILIYQIWLAIAWRIGGKLGDRMTKSMARALKTRSDQSAIWSGMNYPYYIQWTRTYGSYQHLNTTMPACPMLFIYGTRKPFLFHSPGWIAAINATSGSEAVAFDTGHWVMVEQPERFNQTVSKWLANER